MLQSGDRAVLHCFVLFCAVWRCFILIWCNLLRFCCCAPAFVLQCGGVCAAYCSLRGVTTNCWMLFGVVWCCLVLFTAVCVQMFPRRATRRRSCCKRRRLCCNARGACAAMCCELWSHVFVCLCVCVFVCLIAVCRGFWSVFQVISVISVILGVCAVIGRLCCFVVIVQFLSEI